MKSLKTRAPIAFAAAICGLGLTACATPEWARRPLPLDTPQARAESVQMLRQARLRHLSLGVVGLGKGVEEVRGEATYVEPPLVAEAEAAHLRDTLLAQLQGASVYDAQSKWVLSGTVLHTDMRKDHGTVAARFVVQQPDGRVAYERELRASSTWAPALGSAGARWVAKEQSEVYQKLTVQLFSDPGFQLALKR
jgi:hypothetical protein